MPLKLFICYRRDDTAATAGRLYDYLSSQLGKDVQFFMDVDNMSLGTNYLTEIRREVAGCDVLLALIGSEWLAATDKAGRRRLELEKDSVRIEISTALEKDVPTIPVLVDGATIPQENELPTDLASLFFHAGIELRNSSFRNDASRLVGQLKKMADAKAAIQPVTDAPAKVERATTEVRPKVQPPLPEVPAKVAPPLPEAKVGPSSTEATAPVEVPRPNKFQGRPFRIALALFAIVAAISVIAFLGFFGNEPSIAFNTRTKDGKVQNIVTETCGGTQVVPNFYAACVEKCWAKKGDDLNTCVRGFYGR